MRKIAAGLAALMALGALPAQAAQTIVPGKAPDPVGAAEAVVLVDPASGKTIGGGPGQPLYVKNGLQGQATYTAAGKVTLAASATDVFVLTGSASKTIYVTRVRVSGTQTSSGLVEVFLQRHSTANTGGTCSAITSAPMASTSAAASAVFSKCTANPTVGTLAGVVRDEAIPFVTTASAISQPVEYQFAVQGQPIVLSGAGQELAVNLGGVTVTGGVAYVTVEWIEL